MTDTMGGPAVPSADALGTLRPLGHDAFTLDPDGWIGAWHERNVTNTLPHVLTQVENGEAYSNLARVIGEVDTAFGGMLFTDSDVYKTLEAIAWAAPGLEPDDAVMARAQHLIGLLARVQADDGYLNSRVQGDAQVERFADPQWGHELYCAGHLFQAAVAAVRTGSLPELVTVASRFADYLVDRFGPEIVHVEGHPVVETALVELYRATGNTGYLELAQRQIDQRGHAWLGEDQFGSQYFQDHVPVRDAPAATGHAVRQLYLLAGAVDVAVETQDRQLLQAAIATWTDLFATKTYITGAHGSRHRDESIGDPFELPPDRAYAETCAAIASLQLGWRLLLATGQSRFADEMEIALYNAIAGSTSTDGRAFFYSNPLQLRTDHDGNHEDAPGERLPWYTCSCCPPNIARLLASIQDYLLTATDAGIQVHLYSTGRGRIAIADGTADIRVATAYPYDEHIRINVRYTGSADWQLSLRVPSWCADPQVTVDGRAVKTTRHDGYLRLDRSWTGTHDVHLVLPAPPRFVSAHRRVDAVSGCVAGMSGTVLYAIEHVDVPDGVAVEDLQLVSLDSGVEAAAPDGVDAPRIRLSMVHRPSESDRLYDTTTGPDRYESDPVTVYAVPYHLWGNRGPGAMRVWIPVAPATS